MSFSQSQMVVQVKHVEAVTTAYIRQVESVKNDRVRLLSSTADDLEFDDADGQEIDPVSPTIYSEIIALVLS